MDETLMLPVDYNGEELEFEMKIQRGYVTRVEIIIGGLPVVFEPDNDGNFRAIVEPEQVTKGKVLSAGLLQAIAGQLILLFN